MTDPVLRDAAFGGAITAADVVRMSPRVSAYNAVIAGHAASRGVATVDFFSTTIFESWPTLAEDGNHPNGAGYDAIAAIWYQAVGSALTGQIFASGFEGGTTAGWSGVVS